MFDFTATLPTISELRELDYENMLFTLKVNISDTLLQKNQTWGQFNGISVLCSFRFLLYIIPIFYENQYAK